MSRYTIPQDDPTQQVVVGHDGPLQTFFAQVFDLTADADADDCVYWIGDDYDALPTVEALQTALGDVATIPEALCEVLRTDQHTAQPQTPLQRCGRSLFIDSKRSNAREARS